MRKKVIFEAIHPFHGHINYLLELRELARINRHHPTEAETIIWDKVLSYCKTGYKFTRQKPLYRFIADFYCSALNLVIEIDGSSHNHKKGYDQDRDQFFQQIGIRTIRFSNQEIIGNLNSVKTKIHQALPVKGGCPEPIEGRVG